MYNSLPKARSIQQIISDHNKIKKDFNGKPDKATLSKNLKIIKTKNFNKQKEASIKSGIDESTKSNTTKKYKVIKLQPEQQQNVKKAPASANIKNT